MPAIKGPFLKGVPPTCASGGSVYCYIKQFITTQKPLHCLNCLSKAFHLLSSPKAQSEH